ncbi:probable glutaminase A [Rhynchosporium graminicola]|uniref:Probable glutaminase A n=1 Tax=Rhynchosporium graminicola TaxID=2792576 RepID=A0A1E1LCJ7_9HELO|nr:probable glutaminase A [Rhynchosporium commune]
MRHPFFLILLGALTTCTWGSTFSPARPPAIPLAVKSPYMSTWLEVGSDGGSGGNLAGSWPRFWAGPQPGPVAARNGAVTGWAGFIKVDGEAYTWMGAASVNGWTPTLVTQDSFEYTSQRSTFILNTGGKVTMNVTFLSPLTPKDIKRQSIIGTYLSVTVSSRDGANHDVQLYADTSAEWVNPTHNQEPVAWSYSVQNGVASHKSFQRTESEFNADYPDDAAHWGNWYWSTASTPSMSYQSGSDQTVRSIFLSNSVLPDTQDTEYRAISSRWPVFAFSNALGSVGNTPVSTLYTIVHAQKNAIYFNGANGLASLTSLWTSYWSTDLGMVNYFHKDWPSNTGALDHKIAVDSLKTGGQDYLTITSLSARQAFGAVQLCGTPAKPYLFLKEISSDGNTQTVDVLFPTMPIFLYSNPSLVKYMLDPLYENQEAGRFPQTYSLHDLGANYPRAIGHPTGDGEPMPLEECGNMIIATLAYVQRTGDTAYLSQHYKILKQWTGYLVQEALIPAYQLSTDDFQGQLANQTNLALKGIIAIEAMSVVARKIGNLADAKTYTDIAHDYIAKWQDLAVVKAAPPHTNLAYQDPQSHGLLYNLYGDALLGLNLVPTSIYSMQSTFYPSVAQTYGVPLDTRNVFTKSDWEMWVAAISTPSTKSMFISKLANWINTTPTNRAFSDLYNTQTGDFANGPFIARPVVGGHFALLALGGASTAAF